MDTSRWERLQSIFDEASDLDPNSRGSFLDEACAGDEALRAEVESFLAALDGGSDFIGDGLHADFGSAFERFHGLAPGAAMGPYRLVRKIGEGGMSCVYLAERADHQFERQVAIKVLRPEFSTGEMILRFRRERQILANLDHPNIGRMLDGGVGPNGISYVAMEFVDGVSLDQYCRDHTLPMRQVVELFAAICSAVAYAHGKLVIHRDIKPSNILVTADGVPKLLDFGIAKLLAEESVAEQTRATSRVMTMEYASPEQVRGEPVSTASDVYSLGLIFYELLTGCRPFDMAGITASEAQRRICEVDPPLPSANVETPSIAAEVAGDLDSIVMKALRKEPEARYGSVALLEQDLRAYLDGFPVSASKGNTRYRAAKFVRRHKFGIGATVAFGLLLISFSIGMAVLAVRLARERDSAREERVRATEVSGVLTGLLQGADPFRARGRELTAKELLDQGWRNVSKNLERHPDVQAKVLDTIAVAYQHLGDFQKARDLFTAEAQAWERASGRDSRDRTRALRQLADTERIMGNPTDAEAHLREAMDILKRTVGPRDLELAHTSNNLGLILQARGEAAQARDLFEQAAAIAARDPGQTTEVLTMRSNLGSALVDLHRFDEAETVLRDVLARRSDLLGSSHPQVARSMNRLAMLLKTRSKYEESERVFRAGIDGYGRSLPPEHTDIMISTYNLGMLLFEERRLPEAEELLSRVSEVALRTQPTHPDTARWQSGLAAVLAERGQRQRAREIYDHAVTICHARPDPDSRCESLVLLGRSRLLIDMGKLSEAGQDLDRARPALEKLHGPAHPLIAETLFQSARLLGRQHKPVEAAALAQQAVEMDRAAASPVTQAAAHLLGLSALRKQAGDPAAAAGAAREALALLSPIPALSWQASEARSQIEAAQ